MLNTGTIITSFKIARVRIVSFGVSALVMLALMICSGDGNIME